MARSLSEIIALKTRHVIGLVSGTSSDGIDAALVKVVGSGQETTLRSIHFTTVPFSDRQRRELHRVSEPAFNDVEELCRLNLALGELFARAAREVVESSGWSLAQVDLIGSHGQTVRHAPQLKETLGFPARVTLQIGEPAVIAQRTGVITVGDFRMADLAAGGQGAPLLPSVEHLLLRSKDRTRLLINVGGVANLTLLPADGGPEEVVAFDVGPGNMVMDGLAQELFGRSHDENGDIARSGRVNSRLLTHLLSHPFFEAELPKSTGREEFGRTYIDALKRATSERSLPPEDMMATALELTIQAILAGYRRFIENRGCVREVIVSGGGFRNQFLMERLRDSFAPTPVHGLDRHGIDPDAKEAIAFAVLANEAIAGRPGNLPQVTGATARAVLGKICIP